MSSIEPNQTLSGSCPNPYYCMRMMVAITLKWTWSHVWVSFLCRGHIGYILCLYSCKFKRMSVMWTKRFRNVLNQIVLGWPSVVVNTCNFSGWEVCVCVRVRECECDTSSVQCVCVCMHDMNLHQLTRWTSCREQILLRDISMIHNSSQNLI